MTNMSSPFFHEFKKQASFFLKEKIRTARLALTDVTPAELLTEEATNGSPWAPDARTMGFISRAAFEIDDYWRIVEILHKRLEMFDRKRWREPYQAVVLLEHLLTHGPERVSEEFQSDREVIQQMGLLQHIDERGFNWGLSVRNKSERILELLGKGQLLKEERERAREITRGIQGFGSLNHRWTGSVGEMVGEAEYGRSNSHYEPEKQEENNESDREIGVQHIKIERIDKESTSGEVSLVPPEESKPLLDCEAKTIRIREEHLVDNLDNQILESRLLLSN